MRRQLPLIGFALLIFLILGFVVSLQWYLPSERFSLMHGFLYLIDLLALVLALVFGRSTLFLLLLLFLGFAVLSESFDYLRHAHAKAWAHVPVGTLFDYAIHFLALPLISIIAFFQERALFSSKGAARLSLLGGVFLFVALWMYFPNIIPVDAIEKLDLFIFPDLGIADPVLLIWVVTIGALFFHIILYHHFTKIIFFIALFGAMLSASLPKTLDYFLLFTALFSLLSIFFIIANSYYMAYVDELTGIKGRRAMNEALVRLGNRYSIAMVDIDHFKKFNDTYGHDIGDEVLKLVAAEINNVEGGADAFRWGGEEFALIFNGKSAKDAFPFADKVRAAIENHPFYLRAPNRPDTKPEKEAASPKRGSAAAPKPQKVEKLHVTVSMGIGEKSKSDLSATDVMKKADDLLYKAKEAGRNCVKL